jgi:hypothetical protein
MKHFRYLKYLIRHKWFVFTAGLKTKAPLWRLVIHDWSKFLPVEWFPYVESFYGDGTRLRQKQKTPVGLMPSEAITLKQIKSNFDRAWLHHQHWNKHHWQHWVLREDSGDTKILEMPVRFIREMVADWAGAGRGITGKWEVAQWYDKNKLRMGLHPATRLLVEQFLEAWR